MPNNLEKCRKNTRFETKGEKRKTWEMKFMWNVGLAHFGRLEWISRKYWVFRSTLLHVGVYFGRRVSAIQFRWFGNLWFRHVTMKTTTNSNVILRGFRFSARTNPVVSIRHRGIINHSTEALFEAKSNDEKKNMKNVVRSLVRSNGAREQITQCEIVSVYLCLYSVHNLLGYLCLNPNLSQIYGNVQK